MVEKVVQGAVHPQFPIFESRFGVGHDPENILRRGLDQAEVPYTKNKERDTINCL